MRYISANVAGLEISGGTGKIVLAPSGIDGWDDGVDVRRATIDRANGHGSYDAPGFLDSRVVSVPGRVLADTQEELEHIGNRITGLLAGGQSGRIQVSTLTGTQWAKCRLAGQTRFTPDFGRRNATFQLQLWCPDPRKYGNTQDFTRTNGAVEVFHRGNFDAHPTIVVRGSAANGYRINGPGGKQYRVSRPLVTGVPHRIEFNDGLLRVDGNLVPNGVARADVWPVPPGQPATFDVNVINGGTAEATITVTDTYI